MSRRVTQRLFAVLLTATLTGCENEGGHPTSLRDNVAVFLGIAAPPARPSRTVDFVIDPTLHSPASLETVAQTVDGVLADLATRPNPSCIRLWSVGSTVSDARMLAESCVPVADRRPKAQKAAAQRFRESARAYLLKAAQHAFAADPPRRSPLAGTLTRIAMSTSRTDERSIILITDGREESEFGKFECAELPTPTEFVERLAAARVLEPKMLRGVDVTFAFIGFTDAKRPNCETSPRRELLIQELWRVALTRAGATSASFESAAPQITAEVTR